MLLKHDNNLTKPLYMDIFQQNNLKVKNLIQYLNIINEMIKRLSQIEIKETFHIQLKELKKIDPTALIFWYGYYFPLDFFQLLK